MRAGSINGRAALLLADGRGLDIETASSGAFSADPQALYDRWAEVVEWSRGIDPDAFTPVPPEHLGLPVPRPRQVFAVAANYGAHAAEAGVKPPETPLIFTKFPSCLTGPEADVELFSRFVDWEAELVVVMGRETFRIAADQAWSHVAGLTVGQDLSERVIQMQGPMPQMSMGKSMAGFGPMGPAVVSIDEFANPDDLELGCAINGEVMQKARTSEMVFSVNALIAHIASICTLYPGDLIFTGTPQGVGATRDPRRFLAPGETLTTWVEGVGEINNRMTGTAKPWRPAAAA